MTKNLLNLTLLASGLLTAAGAHAESLRVRIPFAFTASGTKLPAGEYSIREMSGNPTVLLIAGSGPGARAMVFARVTGRAVTTGNPLIFEDEGSDGMVLVNVRTSEAWFELGTPKPRTSLASNPSSVAADLK